MQCYGIGPAGTVNHARGFDSATGTCRTRWAAARQNRQAARAGGNQSHRRTKATGAHNHSDASAEHETAARRVAPINAAMADRHLDSRRPGPGERFASAVDGIKKRCSHTDDERAHGRTEGQASRDARTAAGEPPKIRETEEVAVELVGAIFSLLKSAVREESRRRKFFASFCA